MEAAMLVVPIESRWLMASILQSDRVPFSADNTPNVVREGLTGVVWTHLNIGSGAWFLFAKKSATDGGKGHMAKCIMRISPEFDRQNEFLSGDRQYKGRMRVGFGFPDARGIDGSTGA